MIFQSKEQRPGLGEGFVLERQTYLAIADLKCWNEQLQPEALLLEHISAVTLR